MVRADELFTVSFPGLHFDSSEWSVHSVLTGKARQRIFSILMGREVGRLAREKQIFASKELRLN